ncbi:hypothetical protein DNTS_028201 [Danionella cerebrum]|uniref:Coiled-coil domain-containing protein 9B n=1 Tax=Danionella cerebrum TaxID=2873325 RepID=A0A553QR91_9TELE|nr:hypothetical protein DNTS_028201 [Danionella translucida]TRY92502.1 hypothetical protein DNTS_028201 [Danionella translucida]
MQHPEPLITFLDYCEDDDYFPEDEPFSFVEMTVMKKEHKDAELDKRIEALRKKNEALMKRYQEVEEDKKRAEEEGMSLHSRKGKSDELTITISKSNNGHRVVTKVAGPRDGELEKKCDPDSGVFSVGRGKRRQLLVTTPGKIQDRKAFGERKDRNCHLTAASLKICSEEEVHEENTRGKQPEDVKPNILTDNKEHLEYLRWKKERDQIDRERVARHKNDKGQWRRAWDLEKAPLMFSENELGGSSSKGCRNVGKSHLRSEESTARGQTGKSVAVVSSKAKGKDRLTGRARRLDAKEQEEHLQVYPESSLQEFLEELDALCASEKISIHPENPEESLLISKKGTTEEQLKSASSENRSSTLLCLNAIKKKVRFSENPEEKEIETDALDTNEETHQTFVQVSSKCVLEDNKQHKESRKLSESSTELNSQNEEDESGSRKESGDGCGLERTEDELYAEKSCIDRRNGDVIDSSEGLQDQDPYRS